MALISLGIEKKRPNILHDKEKKAETYHIIKSADQIPL